MKKVFMGIIIVLLLLSVFGSVIVVAKKELLSKKSTVVSHKNLFGSDKVGVVFNKSNSVIVEAGYYVYEYFDDDFGVANNLDIVIPPDYKSKYYFNQELLEISPLEARHFLVSEEELEQEFRDALAAEYVVAGTAGEKCDIVARYVGLIE